MVKLFKFIDTDGNVIGISYSDKDGNVTAPAGTTPIEITESEKEQTLLDQKTYQDSITNTPINLFDINTFLLGLMAAFTPITDYANILVFYPMIGDFARAKNFEGMKIFLQALISAGSATQAQYDILNSVLKQQNIDLDNL